MCLSSVAPERSEETKVWGGGGGGGGAGIVCDQWLAPPPQKKKALFAQSVPAPVSIFVFYFPHSPLCLEDA